MANIRDINPLEHITSDLAKSRYNYESILNGLVEWSNSKLDNVTVRLATDTTPYYVDYTFPTRLNYKTETTGVASPDSASGMFSYDRAYDLPALYDPEISLCDSVKLRITVADRAEAEWELYAKATIYDDVADAATREYCKNLYVRRPVNGLSTLCRTVKQVNKGESWSTSPYPVDPLSNWMYAVAPYDPKNLNFYCSTDDVLVSFSGAIYRVSGSIEARRAPSADSSGWTKVCDSLAYVDTVEHNQMYFYDNEFYIYLKEDAPSVEVPSPTADTDGTYWTKPSVALIYLFTVTGTSTFRWKVVTDISGFVMRMKLGSTINGTPDIGLVANLELNSGVEYEDKHKGVSIFQSSNYSMWPSSENAIWTETGKYSTDTSIGTADVQDYTARMVFHHSSDDVRTMNIINYDGPDLDQGLAIYLPVRDKVIVDGNETFMEPCDGYTFEFLFRIWPKPEYNGASTSDLIINKAHIYVYSVESSDKLTGKAPIAKFSMARLTNFYVFAENIGVPNRPVLYKAKFVYCEDERTWKTYDYYQLPDHIFLSPKGFVDPSDRSDDTYGVETAGFPLFQDPFSGLDLSRIMVDDEYMNRMK